MTVSAAGNGSASSAPIPVLDLAGSDGEVAATLKEACEGPGFLYLRGHGISDDLLARVFQQMEALFALPLEEKRKVKQDKNNRGYTAFEEEMLDPGRQKARGDTKEGYYIGVELPEEHPRAQLPLHGPNQWPSADLLPLFRPTMEEYFAACWGVCMRLITIMALALGLPGDYFHQPGRFDNAVGTLRPLHYSREASRPESGVFGCGAHTDFGMLTLLAMDGPGLQICRDPQQSPQEWEAVNRVAGAFVVNIGDMLERWTNGKWKSTLHRVIMPEGVTKDRYSVPFFFEPNFECRVECLPCCTSPDNPPRWPPTTFGEHILSMYNKTHMGLDESLKTPTSQE